MRPATSCIQCRKRRVRCDRPTKEGPCNRCKALSKDCSHDVEPRMGLRALQTADELAFTGPGVMQIVDDYIRCIHDRPYSLFHEPTLRRMTSDGTISKALLFAICSIGCRFSRDPTVRRSVQKYFAEARKLFHMSLESVTISTLQTCVLLANIFATEDQPVSETLYFSMAQRMVQILELEKADEVDSPIERELNKRIRLSLYTADCWHSRGSGMALMSQDHHLPAEVAIDEHTFHSPYFGQQPVMSGTPPGLWAHRTELATIFKRAQTFVASVAEGTLTNTEADGEAAFLASELEGWYAALPAATVFSEANLERHIQNGRGGAYIDLFLGYHYYNTLLFFPFLGRQPPTDTEQHPFVERCRFHALRYSTLLQITHSRPHCEAVHRTVGHMTVVSSSALLYFLLSDNQEELPSIRDALLSNFVVIEQLSAYWSKAKEWTTRLLVFHDAVSDWSFSESYTMDRWMMRFLLEYALPLDSRRSPVRTRSVRSDNRDTPRASDTSSPDMMKALQALL